MANSKIRGITIEIGGDTTKLDKALGNVDKKVKGTQVELREVNKLLKIDPTNTEMLAQKQALLSDAISETKEKLDILKNAESQVQEQGRGIRRTVQSITKRTRKNRSRTCQFRGSRQADGHGH